MPKRRYERAMEEFRQAKFRRMLLAAVIGVLLAHYLDMPNTVLVGLYPCTFLLSMDRFSFGVLGMRCGIIIAGLVFGTLMIETFGSMPILAGMGTFAVFFIILKLFAAGYEVANAYSFGFTYILATINGSYQTSTMEQAITEYYLIQVILIFFIVWGCFAIFPNEKPKYRRLIAQAKKPSVPEWELAIYSAILLLIWLVFQLFEWKFAIFAFLSFMGAFRYFERKQMKTVLLENMFAHSVSCFAVAFFSMLLFSLTGNLLIFALGVVLLMAPFLHNAVYPSDPRLAYRGGTMISGVLVPLVLYVGTDHAAVYQSSLRARLIILLMLLLWMVVEFMYHSKNTIKFTRRLVRRLPIIRKEGLHG